MTALARLVPAHLADLEGSGLSTETILGSGIYSAAAAEVAALLGYGCGPGMAIPYPQANGGPPFVRVKLDHAGPDGKRYRTRKGGGNRLYIPPTVAREALADLTRPLYIVEGEKKCLKANQEGLLCIGLAGVRNWRTTMPDGRTGPVPELDAIPLKDRPVYIVFDADPKPKTIADVRQAETALATELARRGGRPSAIRLPLGPDGQKVGLDDYLLTHSIETFCALEPVPLAGDPAAPVPYLETLAEFLAEDDPPLEMVFPEILPRGVIMLLHGEPRARKSLVAFELALSAATGTAPFGLPRLQPSGPIPVLYIQEEDHRSPTRTRTRRIVAERCGERLPDTLHVSVRRGVDLDDPVWVARIAEDARRLGVQLIVLDAARRLSAKTDEGPQKVRELIAVLRSLVVTAAVTIIVVHHDVKPPANGQDPRRRSQRASGGDWFAGSECPVHVERVNEAESLVFPQDYKFSADPAPFTFRCVLDGPLIKRLVATDTTTDQAETAGSRGKLLDWLRTNGPASKTAMRKAGFRWETLDALLDPLIRANLVDHGPGRNGGKATYFVVGNPSLDGSEIETADAS